MAQLKRFLPSLQYNFSKDKTGNQRALKKKCDVEMSNDMFTNVILLYNNLVRNNIYTNYHSYVHVSSLSLNFD